MHYLLTHKYREGQRKPPDSIAFRFADDQLEYAQLNARANQLACQLIEMGIRKADRVGIYMHKSLDLPVAIYGIMKAGAAYVPIDPLAPIDRIAFILNDCQIKCLITQGYQTHVV